MRGQNATDHGEGVGARRPTDSTAVAYGVGWFAAVLLIALGLWLVEFQVDARLQQAGAYGVVGAFLAWTQWGTPSSRLTPDRRAARESRVMTSLLGGSLAVLLLGGFAAAFQLRSWSEWVVLAGLFIGTLGVGITLHAHLLFRRR